MTSQAVKTCARCGEEVRPHWTLCPACEARLPGPACPGCGSETKAHWVICPECHTRLKPGKKAAAGSSGTAASGTWTEPRSGIDFIRIPPGSFMMGDAEGDGLENEQPIHDVELDAFYMAKTPVTNRQFQQVTGREPESETRGPDHPVTFVDYDQIRDFLRILNEHHNGARRFSLPTEAQWEYAARSGGKHERYAGSDSPDAVAWYGENSEGFLHDVALKKPNGLGLYDMSGNVWEWCRDVYSETAYAAHGRRNPLTDGDGPADRVARGGNFMMDAWSLRCSRRFSFPEALSGKGLGFRPVMVIA
ncbi:hypothetical protein JCM14469_10510 [Desulfatiferula olefinivorans]